MRTSSRQSLSKKKLKCWLSLYNVTRMAETHLREFLRVKHDTTLPRFDVMAALWRRPEGVSMSELSRMLLVSNGNTSSVVDRLVKDGYVERLREGGDRRVIQVALSVQGRASFEVMARSHEEEVARLFAPLSVKDIDTLESILGPLGRRWLEDGRNSAENPVRGEAA